MNLPHPYDIVYATATAAIFVLTLIALTYYVD